MGNNPISFVDPDGRQDGKVVYQEGDITSQNFQIGEVVATPTGPLQIQRGGQTFIFYQGCDYVDNNKMPWTPDNFIENYYYYLNNKEKFGDAKFEQIFVSDQQRRQYVAEDALYEIVDIITPTSARGNSGAITKTLSAKRRSQYANLFPSNKKEFTPTLQQKQDYSNYIIEKSLPSASRSPEFSIWQKQFEGSQLLFNQ